MVIYNTLPRWSVILEEMINAVELERAEKEKGAVTTAPANKKQQTQPLKLGGLSNA